MFDAKKHEMSRILGISLKSVLSFEQGSLKITPQAERQAPFLVAPIHATVQTLSAQALTRTVLDGF